MSPLGAKYGVLDPDLKVKGVKGLRIVDASVVVTMIFASFDHDVCHICCWGEGGGFNQGYVGVTL